MSWATMCMRRNPQCVISCSRTGTYPETGIYLYRYLHHLLLLSHHALNSSYLRVALREQGSALTAVSSSYSTNKAPLDVLRVT